MSSHYDASADIRAFFGGIWPPITKRPTTINAARSARAAGEPVLMGAPIVVRGGSQTGNIAAADLIRKGQVDALVSDYYCPALPQSA